MRRKTSKSSLCSGRTLVPEDENLERPVERESAEQKDAEQLPLHSREPRQPAALAGHARDQADDADQRAREQRRPKRVEANRVREIPAPHVREGPRAAAERAGMAG